VLPLLYPSTIVRDLVQTEGRWVAWELVTDIPGYGDSGAKTHINLFVRPDG
jgi:hypothetical protein